MKKNYDLLNDEIEEEIKIKAIDRYLDIAEMNKPIDDVLIQEEMNELDKMYNKIEIEEIDTRQANHSLLDEWLAKVQTLGELSIENTSDISGCTGYSCTFTYNPYSKFSISDTIDKYITYDDKVFLQDPKKYTRTKKFIHFSFKDQYRIFTRHFDRWVNRMNGILDKKDKIRGWSVWLEQTKLGTLHAHSIIYSPIQYDEAFGNYCAASWASIAKGSVRAMKRAFEKMRNKEGWNEYIQKNKDTKIDFI